MLKLTDIILKERDSDRIILPKDGLLGFFYFRDFSMTFRNYNEG